MKCKIKSKMIPNINMELFSSILWAISDADKEKKLTPAFKDVFSSTFTRTLLTRVPYSDFPRQKPEGTDWLSFLLNEAAFLFDDIWISQLLKKESKDKNVLLSTAGFYPYEVELLIRICDRHNVDLSEYADAINDLLPDPWFHLCRDLRREYPERVSEVNKRLAETVLRSYGKGYVQSHPAPSEMDYILTNATVRTALSRKKKPSPTGDSIKDLILEGISLSPEDSEVPDSEPEK